MTLLILSESKHPFLHVLCLSTGAAGIGARGSLQQKKESGHPTSQCCDSELSL